MTEQISHHNINGIEAHVADDIVGLAFRSNELLDQIRAGGHAADSTIEARRQFNENNETIGNLTDRPPVIDDISSTSAEAGGSDEIISNERLTPERISQIASESIFSATTWMYGREIPNSNRDGVGGFLNIFNKGKWANERRRAQVPSFRRYEDETKYKKFMDGFIEAGISEIVTVQVAPESAKWKSLDSNSVKAEDGIVAIHYQTLTRAGTNEKYRQLCPDGRPGNYLDVLMYLPRSDAEELVGAVQEDPNVIRQLIDTQMREQVGAQESWEQAKPPYSQWEEVNGGVSRIALRSSVNQGVEESKILEFQAAA